MANFCLPKEFTTPFLRALKDGTLDPQKLSQMESGARRAEFAKVIGEEFAKEVNTLFESKLLLKNQQAGIINWAKSVGGLKPEAMKDLLSKVEKMDRLLNPAQERAFLSDLAEKKLGARVTVEEAKQITALAREAQVAKDAMATGGDRMAYGRAKVKFSNYVSGLKNEANKLTLREKGVGGVTSEVAGISKGLKASMDNSAIFRQGWKTLFSHPGIWMKNTIESFSNIAKQFRGKEVMDEVHADIVSRPTYDLMQRAKLDVGSKLEEQFPTHIIGKVPGLGRLYRTSEAAYTAFVQKTRADVFDKYLQIAENAGLDIASKTELEAIGKMVNSLTGRGYLGKGELVANQINNVFFSPRLLKSNLDFLTAHQLQGGVTPFVRKQAAMNLAKVVAGSAAILAIADAVLPGSVEKDPRSADFGKIRVRDSRFDVTGGMGSILTLAARLATNSTKSSTTKRVTQLGTGKFGSSDRVDVLVNFAQNKFSPAASVMKDLLVGHDFKGNKPTVLGEASNLLTPLPVANAWESFKNPNAAPLLSTIIADGLGISVNTYSAPKPK
jgi:hypothetical protein